MASVRIPTELVNYICELAAGKKCKWYPFFCPKTGKLNWKLNIHSNKWHKYSKRFMKTVKIFNPQNSTAQCYLNGTQTLLFTCPIYYTIYPKYYYYEPYMISKMYHEDIVYNMNINVQCNYFYNFNNNEHLYEPCYYLGGHIEKYIYNNDTKCYRVMYIKVYHNRVMIYVNLI